MPETKYVDLESLKRFKQKQDAANVAKYLGTGETATAASKVSHKLKIKNGSVDSEYDGSAEISIDITPPKAATATELGLVSVGDNISVTNGKISIEAVDIKAALGNTPTERAEKDANGKVIHETYVEKDGTKVLSSNDYTDAEKAKLAGIEATAQVNKIEVIKVNGAGQVISNKEVNITVPTKTSELVNDAGFATATGGTIEKAVKAVKLETPRNINGVPFDGTADITIEDNTKVALSKVGAVNGVASLDAAGKVPSSQLPSYVDDVINVANYAALTALSDKQEGVIYVVEDTNKVYRYVQASDSFLQIGAEVSTADTANEALKLKTARNINGVAFDGTADITITQVANATNAAKAGEATKLETPRTINGVAFDGTANIVVADNTKLPLTGGTVTGDISADHLTASTFTGDVVGNATSATKLKTAVKINGIDFDGTADIMISAEPSEVISNAEILALFN